MYFRPLPVMSILSVVAFVILLMFGNWQWGKYQDRMIAPDSGSVDVKVAITASDTNYPYQFDYETYAGQALWRVYQPVMGCVEGASVCDNLLFVNTALLMTLNPSDHDVVFPAFRTDGLTPVPDQTAPGFGVKDDGQNNQWQSISSARMAEKLGDTASGASQLFEPDQIERIRFYPDGSELRETIENPFAQASSNNELPPARHLGYALTWFGLAATLIGVYLAFHISKGRLRFGGQLKDDNE